ncbi:hypothetical protein RRG08_008187 [Elysia crispata]|uniref:Uncharacterized protein n=1 Tax=Elysia crispata TaxID=231223 RepID=A0AAE1DTA5_9GAST|nr:hypothetical protein RRG08_008187 [Elysia crispata]
MRQSLRFKRYEMEEGGEGLIEERKRKNKTEFEVKEVWDGGGEGRVSEVELRIEEDVGRPRGRERGGRDDKLGWRENIERKKTEKQ